jgi:thiamine-monophosphate kinase
VPCRTGAKAGDALWVSGTIGDAGAGLKLAQHEMQGPESLLDRYRRPQPRLEAGQMLAPVVGAMIDVSDGLLIDAGRMAQASRLAIRLQLEAIPLSDAYRTSIGEDRTCRTAAATAGDDYELLFSASEGETRAIERMSQTLALPLTKIGRFSEGSGIALFDASQAIPLPDRMGWEHGSA